MAGRIRRLSCHLLVDTCPVAGAGGAGSTEVAPQRHGFVGPDPNQMEQYRAALPAMPRVNKDLRTWTTSELLRRCQGLGATDERLAAIIEGDGSRDALLALAQQLEPPPPQTVTPADITVDARSNSIESMAETLDRFGAVVVTNAASAALIDAIDAQLESAGAWAISRGEQAAGRPASRMHMELLTKAPLAGELVTNEYVLGVSRFLLEPHCKRIALKELCAFEVQPGNVAQHFHREDRASVKLVMHQFWPWHHEPDTWAVNMLWALDDFTPENGGTQMIPYSHRSTMYMRENGREFLEGNYDPNDVLKLRMPRGSVLLFAGGLMHGSGANKTSKGRKCLLSAFQLGWLRPEYKFWAHKELHQALSEGKLSAKLTDLMGHFEYEDPSVQPGDAGRVENAGEYQSMVQEEPYLGVGMQHMELATARPPLKKGQGFAALFPY